MRNRKKCGFAENLITSVIFMVAVIGIAVLVTLHFRQLYYMDIDYFNLPEQTGLSREVIKENYDALIDYNSLFGPDKLVFPTLSQSEHGEIHFAEVKVIFMRFEIAGLICMALSIILLVRRILKKDLGYLKLAGALTVILPSVVGAAVALNWNWAFVTFHKIMFDNDYWLFDPATDPIIDLLPDGFFMHCAIMIVAIVIILAVIAFVCGVIFGRKDRRNEFHMR